MAVRLTCFALALATLLAGCPASTTLQTDAGPGVDGARVDAGGTTLDSGSTDVDSGAPPTWDSCAHMADCALAPSGCCPTCAIPALADVDAVNVGETSAHFDEVCPVPMPCPRCATGDNANLVAVCASSHCAAVDVSMLPLSACTSDADCIIRYANCCGCTGMTNEVVSVRGDAEGAVEQLLCDGGACAADCAPRPDPNFVARCEPATQHCIAQPINP